MNEEKTVKIYEEGNGFPEEGELIYHAKKGEILLVIEIISGIQTRGGAGNYKYAKVEYYGTPSDLSDADFENLRDIYVDDGKL